MKKEKVILNTDPSIVEYKQVSGWVGKDGRFYGKDERAARYANSTHVTCECGNIIRRGWTKCESCREISYQERYNAYPFEEWNGTDAVYSTSHERYFFDEGEVEDYCENNDVDKNDLNLVLCIKNYYQEVESDYWEDCWLEDWDGESPKKLEEALNALNKVIKELPHVSVSPSNTRTKAL